jgi:hypothetical protein
MHVRTLTQWSAVLNVKRRKIAAPRGGGERVKAPSDFCSFRDSGKPKLTPLKAALRACLYFPGGDGIGPSVARAAGAQSWGQGRHDQALVGAKRSRVGNWLGLPVFSKPDDDTGTRSGEWLKK